MNPPEISAIAQVRLPVTDLARSIDWYCRLLSLRLWTEFVEDGELRGAGLIDDAQRFGVALRLREACAGTPDLAGFDVVAFRPADRPALDAIAARCDRLGIDRTPVRETPSGAVLDATDPDGTVVRFYQYSDPTDGFTGFEFDGGRLTGVYHAPRSGRPERSPVRPRAYP